MIGFNEPETGMGWIQVTRVSWRFFIAPCPVLYVDSGDVLALFAGIAIVIFVAIMANPQYLSELQNLPERLLNPAETVHKPLFRSPLNPNTLNRFLS